jgi:hypothetical protein
VHEPILGTHHTGSVPPYDSAKYARQKEMVGWGKQRNERLHRSAEEARFLGAINPFESFLLWRLAVGRRHIHRQNMPMDIPGKPEEMMENW